MSSAVPVQPRAVDDESPPTWAIELLAEVRQLRGDLARLQGRSTLSRADRRILSKLLPALAGALGSELFLSCELLEHAAVGLVCKGMSARQLGRLLRRSTGVPVDGYLVERVDEEAGAVVWRVVAVADFLGGQNSGVPLAGALSGSR
jgi:hypothetical protein